MKNNTTNQNELTDKKDEITILMIRAGERPQEMTIENTLEAKQKLVDGYIEMYYLPTDDDAVIICNEEMCIRDRMNKQRMEEAYQKAISYNERRINPIIGDPFSEDIQEESADYTEILNVNGTMGVIEIPKIKVNLPIYHGTSESVLSRGVGHLKNTALPVGGTGTHAVLTGHRGYACLLYTSCRFGFPNKHPPITKVHNSRTRTLLAYYLSDFLQK